MTLQASSTHLRLKSDGRIDRLAVDDSFWPRLMNGELGDFHHEYLLSCATFESDWQQWEMHPAGDEIVLLLSGAADLLLDGDSGVETVTLRRTGDFAFVTQGTWHTADMPETSTLLFITAGEGTQGRPRTS